ncbi:MAG: inositol monophosphatase family protein [Candidatus Omnitrophota bacterium]|nr:inositol monophosphatase [Candidatus Omnitrophota bacterium]
MNELIQMKEVAVLAAKKAGKYAFERIDAIIEVNYKSGANNLVTDVDRKCEQMILNVIKSEFPSHSILAEETGEHSPGGEVTWVVDPLDGTTNYAHGFPVFCVSIGIMVGDVVKIGVVYDASRNELFTAIKGQGAFLNDQTIRVSNTELVKNALLATGFPYDQEGKILNIDYFKIVLNQAQAVRRAGSAAIDLCYVACGRFDGFWEFGLSPWDTAAGHLIVGEAGGKVSAVGQGEYDIFKKEITATNGRIHDELLSYFRDFNKSKKWSN